MTRDRRRTPRKPRVSQPSSGLRLPNALPRRSPRGHPPDGANPPWLRHAWQAQSLLLAYPDERFHAQLPLVRRVSAAFPPHVGEPLLRFADHAARTPASALAADYVATFDHRKRCCLFVTYYAHGDTRKRGVALLRLKQAYARAGWHLGDDELPDHLAVLLEFAAATDDARLLVEHRAGLELPRLALRDAGSPWADVLTSVSATLPALTGDDRTAVARLAAEGPPEEEVGLAPYIPTDHPGTAPAFPPATPGGPR